jgi:hypothetical protein
VEGIVQQKLEKKTAMSIMRITTPLTNPRPSYGSSFYWYWFMMQRRYDKRHFRLNDYAERHGIKLTTLGWSGGAAVIGASPGSAAEPFANGYSGGAKGQAPVRSCRRVIQHLYF